MPTGSPLGFTSTLIAAGRVPTEGVRVIHCVSAGARAVVNAAALVPELMLNFCATGNADPVTQVKDNNAGFEVSVGVGACAAARTASRSARGK